MPEPIKDQKTGPSIKDDKHVDYTKYPEGFEAALELLDFLPDDRAVRRQFLTSLMETLARR